MSQDSPASSPFSPPFFTARLTPSGLQVDAWADQPLLHSLEQGGVDWLRAALHRLSRRRCGAAGPRPLNPAKARAACGRWPLE